MGAVSRTQPSSMLQVIPREQNPGWLSGAHLEWFLAARARGRRAGSKGAYGVVLFWSDPCRVVCACVSQAATVMSWMVSWGKRDAHTSAAGRGAEPTERVQGRQSKHVGLVLRQNMGGGGSQSAKCQEPCARIGDPGIITDIGPSHHQLVGREVESLLRVGSTTGSLVQARAQARVGGRRYTTTSRLQTTHGWARAQRRDFGSCRNGGPQSILTGFGNEDPTREKRSGKLEHRN